MAGHLADHPRGWRPRAADDLNWQCTSCLDVPLDDDRIGKILAARTLAFQSVIQYLYGMHGSYTSVSSRMISNAC